MKRILILITVFSTFFLTSCQINWFGAHYDVPWWVIAIPTVIFLTAVWFLAGKSIARRSYRCPKCDSCFHPKWWAAAFSIHMGNDRAFKCPHCGRKGFCKPE